MVCEGQPSERNAMIILSTTLQFTESFPLSGACLILPSILFRGHSSEKGCYLLGVKQVENQDRSPGLALRPRAVRAGPPGAREAAQAGNGLHPLEPPGQPRSGQHRGDAGDHHVL